MVRLYGSCLRDRDRGCWLAPGAEDLASSRAWVFNNDLHAVANRRSRLHCEVNIANHDFVRGQGQERTSDRIDLESPLSRGIDKRIDVDSSPFARHEERHRID